MTTITDTQINTIRVVARFNGPVLIDVQPAGVTSPDATHRLAVRPGDLYRAFRPFTAERIDGAASFVTFLSFGAAWEYATSDGNVKVQRVVHEPITAIDDLGRTVEVGTRDKLVSVSLTSLITAIGE